MHKYVRACIVINYVCGNRLRGLFWRQNALISRSFSSQTRSTGINSHIPSSLCLLLLTHTHRLLLFSVLVYWWEGQAAKKKTCVSTPKSKFSQKDRPAGLKLSTITSPRKSTRDNQTIFSHRCCCTLWRTGFDSVKMGWLVFF